MTISGEDVFDITHKCAGSKSRAGVLHLAHGDVQTPLFMPVGTRGAVKAISKGDLEEIGFEMILANTYHLYLRPGTDVIEKAGGLHGFTGWNHNFLTDSGGFQIFSLSPLRTVQIEGAKFKSCVDGSSHFFTPESVVDIQTKFNSDIQMQLDVCTGFGIEKKEAINALEITNNWAKRAAIRWREKRDQGYKGLLLPIVQGNFFSDLRAQSVETVLGLNLPAVAIGGLSVGEDEKTFSDMLDYTVSLLPENKAKYVMGIGTPDYILEAVRLGIDMFDCVLPTRNARNGSYFTRDGNLSIKQERFKADFSPIDRECGCKICRNYSRAYLRHLFKEQEILSAMAASFHNLYFLYNMILEIRQSIKEDRFEQYRKNFLNRWHAKQII